MIFALWISISCFFICSLSGSASTRSDSAFVIRSRICAAAAFVNVTISNRSISTARAESHPEPETSSTIRSTSTAVLPEPAAAERAALAAANFEEGFLDDSPICDKCGGSGYVGSTMCECLSELCRQEQKKEISVLSNSRETFSQFRLDYYPDAVDPKYGASPRTIMERTLNICRRYAATFTPNAGNLLFIGGTGLGKTFLSACIARTVTDRGYSVVYETSSHLFSKLEQAKFSPSDDTRREAAKLTNSDLLILDDLGTEMPGQFVTAALYSLLNDRMMAVKPMVISTNLNVDELSRRYSPQIASRLHGDFQRLTFVGNDIRVLKNRGL